MPIFRKDPFGRAWVLMSPERGLLPSDFGSVPAAPAVSPLSPGNEGRVATEIASFKPTAAGSDGAQWRMRVIGHPNELVSPRPFTEEGDDLFRHGPSSGYQEIIVEHPDARQTLDRMSSAHLVDVLRLYRDRIALHASKPDVEHIQLTRNVGRAAGALFEHPHAQLLAVPVPNRWVEEEMEAARAHQRAHGECLFCASIARELVLRERVVTHNDEFVALAPYAAKTPFETWILPRRHGSGYAGVPANTLPQLAYILQVVLKALNDALDSPPYNLVLHTAVATDAADFHWHMELLPRLTSQAGFDWGYGFFVNPTPPEDAVRFLRAALALQEVAG